MSQTNLISVLTPLEVAYIAGVIESKASLNLMRHKTFVTPSIEISHKNINYLHIIAQLLGGSVYISNPPNRVKKWIIKGQLAIDILSAIKPYCTIMSPLITILEEYQNWYLTRPRYETFRAKHNQRQTIDSYIKRVKDFKSNIENAKISNKPENYLHKLTKKYFIAEKGE